MCSVLERCGWWSRFGRLSLSWQRSACLRAAAPRAPRSTPPPLLHNPCPLRCKPPAAHDEEHRRLLPLPCSPLEGTSTTSTTGPSTAKARRWPRNRQVPRRPKPQARRVVVPAGHAHTPSARPPGGPRLGRVASSALPRRRGLCSLPGSPVCLFGAARPRPCVLGALPWSAVPVHACVRMRTRAGGCGPVPGRVRVWPAVLDRACPPPPPPRRRPLNSYPHAVPHMARTHAQAVFLRQKLWKLQVPMPLPEALGSSYYARAAVKTTVTCPPPAPYRPPAPWRFGPMRGRSREAAVARRSPPRARVPALCPARLALLA